MVHSSNGSVSNTASTGGNLIGVNTSSNSAQYLPATYINHNTVTFFAEDAKQRPANRPGIRAIKSIIKNGKKRVRKSKWVSAWVTAR